MGIYELTQFHPKYLFLSLNLSCKDLVPQKKGMGKAVSVLIVLAIGLSLCAQNRKWTLYKRWVHKS